jgi:hypothetical protein
VAGHRPGVAEAEVDVLVAVDVGERGAGRRGREHRMGASPLAHPRHRDAGEQRALRLIEELARAAMGGGETLLLSAEEVA